MEFHVNLLAVHAKSIDFFAFYDSIKAKKEMAKMKKIWAIIMATIIISSTTANAAWEFDEKVIQERKGVDISGKVVNGVIETYRISYGDGRDYYEILDKTFDLKGKEIEKVSDDANVDDIITYFTDNKQSIIVDDKGIGKLYDLHGKLLASDFQLTGIWEKSDVARKVMKEGKYGIMSYDGRLIIPMENEGAVIYDNNVFAAVNGQAVTAYNYWGERMFTLDTGIEIVDAGSADWIVVRSETEEKYALINYKGEYLTNFEYKNIKIYDNNEEWQSGSFAVLYKEKEEMYVNRNFEEINIFSEKGVYCQGYEEVGDIAIINNRTENSDLMTALYNKSEMKYSVPFRYGEVVTNGEVMIYNAEKNSYLLDVYGNNINKMNFKVFEISSFEEGVAMVIDRNWSRYFVDYNIKKIFPDEYKNCTISRIDNNEFLVSNTKTVKILTAKGIIGEALYTDVKIDINGVKIPCRSVYGYAAVVAEDLRNFGFDVIWDEENRMLRITRNPDYYTITPMQYEADGVSGEHYADIYGSDINVEYNGKRLSSYCIDGRTLIKIEDLAAEGITFDYDNAMRTLYMSVDGLERK